MTAKRLKPEDRKRQILAAALKLSSEPGGWSKLTRESVANEAQCCPANVSLHFGTMVAFRRTIMRAAITEGNLSVIAQGVAYGDKTALKAPAPLKVKALETLAG